MKAPELPFDVSAQQQQAQQGHEVGERGSTHLTDGGKLVVAALLLGGAVWYLHNYGWPFGATPRTNNGRK